MLEWCDEAAAPKNGRERDAYLAARIDALRAMDEVGLSRFDPLAVIERWTVKCLSSAADMSDIPEAFRPPLQLVNAMELFEKTPVPRSLVPIAIARVLAVRERSIVALLSREDLHGDGEAHARALRSSLPRLLAWCASAVATIHANARAWLLARARETPDGALVAGLDRAVLRIALGDASELADVTAAFAPDSDRAHAVGAAIASGACARSAIPWLQRAAERDADAAIMLLAVDDAAASRTALQTLAALPAHLESMSAGYDQGLITLEERDAASALGERARAALAATGADGALLAALQTAIAAHA